MHMTAYRRTLLAQVPRHWIYYVMGLPLVVGYLIFLLGDPTDYRPYLFLFLIVGYGGIVSGATLAELATWPVSFLLPGQKQVLSRCVILAGLFWTGLSVLGLLTTAVNTGGGATLTEAAGLAAWSLTLFFLFVFLMLFTIQAGIIALSLVSVFGFFSLSDEREYLLLAVNRVVEPLIDRPLVGAASATVLGWLILRQFNNRNFARTLLERPFLSISQTLDLKNEIKVREKIKRARMLRKQHRDPGVTREHSPGVRDAIQGTGTLSALLRQFLWRTNWSSILTSMLIVTLLVFFSGLGYGSDALFGVNPDTALVLLLLPVLMSLADFRSYFSIIINPLLPWSRGHYFRSFLAQAAVLYVAMLALQLAFILLFHLLQSVVPDPYATALRTVTLQPLGIVFLVALLTVPAACWMFLTVRSLFLFMMCFIALLLAGAYILIEYTQVFLALPLAQVVLITIGAWTPFLLQAFNFCFRHDLIRA